METIDWNKVLIRSSSLSYLFTEPKSKADKDAGNMSATAKTHLKQVYIREKYGRSKDIQTRAMTKGLECEDDSILMLSKFNGELYEKNEERFSNQWITGLPDIITTDTVIDVKTCQDIWTFHDKVGESIPDLYYAQIQAYLWLTNRTKGQISYCLTDATDQMVVEEQLYAFRKGNYVTELSPDFIQKSKEIEKAMTYQDIPLSEKIWMVNIELAQEFIEKIPQKVENARKYLQEYDQILQNKSI